MSRFLSERLSGLQVYTPGEQPKDFDYIKLNTNESPYPPSSKVICALTAGEAEKLRLYPDPECADLKNALAEEYGVSNANIFVSNGSDETLSFAFMAFCDRTRGVAFPNISYGFYSVYAQLYGVPYFQKPLWSDFSLCVEDYIGIGQNIVIANPNAPTGLTVSVPAIEEIVRSNADRVVIIDEAYADFSDVSCVALTKIYKNLLVVRTFSKSRQLAGARLGYAIADRELIADLERIKYSTNPYNINRLSLIAGIEAIRDKEYFEQCRREIIETREYTKKELLRLGFTVTDSKANFVFAAHPDFSGREIYLRLKECGILVRHFDKPEIAAYNRITVGAPQEMQTLIQTLEKIVLK